MQEFDQVAPFFTLAHFLFVFSYWKIYEFGRFTISNALHCTTPDTLIAARVSPPLKTGGKSATFCSIIVYN